MRPLFCTISGKCVPFFAHEARGLPPYSRKGFGRFSRRKRAISFFSSRGNEGGIG